jgi:ubiquinone biosynthesis protein COQ4
MQMKYKINYKQAYASYKRLWKNPSNTFLIFQFTRHLVSPSLKHNYAKLLKSDLGGEACYISEEISDYTDTLSQRPEGSVGRECYKLFPKNDNLIKISKRKQENRQWMEARHPYSWMARRNIETHDIWHTLTGYPPDDVGEMCLSAFSFAQTKFIGWLLIAVGFLKLNGINIHNIQLMLKSYVAGKRAKYLLAEDYNLLLSENLTDARVRLNINAHNTQN